MKAGDVIIFSDSEKYVVISLNDYWVNCNLTERAVNHKDETDATFYRVGLEKLISDGKATLHESTD